MKAFMSNIIIIAEIGNLIYVLQKFYTCSPSSGQKLMYVDFGHNYWLWLLWFWCKTNKNLPLAFQHVRKMTTNCKDLDNSTFFG